MEPEIPYSGLHEVQAPARSWTRKLSAAWRLTRRILIALFVAQLVYLIALRWMNPPITVTQLSNWFQGNGLHRDYVSIDEMSANARLAVIASEDQLFPYHSGFDWKSIQEAVERNKKSRRIRGASTLSQQAAKNVFLWQGRSWFRKGLEVYFTFMIETLWGKRRILEVYLNVSEMGTGVFGIEAAARHYFRKPASKLTANEAAMIASCLPNPKKYRVKPMSDYVAKRYPQIVVQMNNIRSDQGVAALIE